MRLPLAWGLPHASFIAFTGTPTCLRLVAQDVVDHFEQGRETLDGKAMVVCMCRRIRVEQYRELVKRRYAWHDETTRAARCLIREASNVRYWRWMVHIEPDDEFGAPAGGLTSRSSRRRLRRRRG